MGFIFGSCDLPIQQCQALREQQVCLLGWALLFLWLGTILYMTREMWCSKLNSSGSSTSSLLQSSHKTSTIIEIE